MTFLRLTASEYGIFFGGFTAGIIVGLVWGLLL